MQHIDELMDLRAKRIGLIKQLNRCNNAQRQDINKRLMSVSKRIQKLATVPTGPGKS